MAPISPFVRGLAVLIALAYATAACAQVGLDDPPQVLKPQPPTKKDKQAESLKQYALGLICEKEDRLLEALQAYEKAAELDSEAVPVQNKLLAFYVALDRPKDALTTCEKILQLTPQDAKVWQTYAQILNSLGKRKDAAAALDKGLKSLDAATHLDLAQQMHFDLASIQLDLLQLLQAAESFRNSAQFLKQALKEMPLEPAQQQEIQARLALLYEKAGGIYVEAKQYDKALAAFQDAQKSDPGSAARWNLQMAHIYQQQGKLDGAFDAINLYLKSRPPGTEAYELKIAVLEKLGKTKEILPWLDKAATDDAANLNLQVLLADQYVQRGLPAKGEALYVDLVKDHPKAEIYLKLFKVQQSTSPKGLKAALDLVNQKVEQSYGKEAAGASKAKLHVKAMVAALKSEPALARSLLQVGLPLLEKGADIGPGTLAVLGELAFRDNELQDAEKIYRAALAKVDQQTEQVVYYGLLEVLLRAKQYKKVLAVCEGGLAKAEATNHLMFYECQTDAYIGLGKMDQAVTSAKKALAIVPESRRLTMTSQYVRALTLAARYADAEAECHKLLKAHKQPGDIVAIRTLLADIYSRQHNFPKAENELQLILKVDPNNVHACNDLGYFWAEQGKNLNEAEKLIRKALELDRDQNNTFLNPNANAAQDKLVFVDSLGWVLFRQGKLDEARKELERARNLPGGDQDPVVADHLGDVYFKLNLMPQALKCWNQAVALYEQEDKAWRQDQHYKDLKEKIKQLKPITP